MRRTIKVHAGNGTFVVFLILILGLLPSRLYAQATAHYVPGVEGIKAASLPPPGLYLRDYNVFYTSGQLDDKNGHEIAGTDLNTFVYAQVPRLVWITDTKFLGGNVGLDALVPIVQQDTRVNTPGGPFHGDEFSIGDPFAESTLSWHPQQFDFSLAAGCWFPAGRTAAPPNVHAGLGYWGAMLTAGATWYPDTEKKWAISALNRYELNSEQRHTHITPGNAWTLSTLR